MTVTSARTRVAQRLGRQDHQEVGLAARFVANDAVWDESNRLPKLDSGLVGAIGVYGDPRPASLRLRQAHQFGDRSSANAIATGFGEQDQIDSTASGLRVEDGESGVLVVCVDDEALDVGLARSQVLLANSVVGQAAWTTPVQERRLVEERT